MKKTHKFKLSGKEQYGNRAEWRVTQFYSKQEGKFSWCALMVQDIGVNLQYTIAATEMIAKQWDFLGPHRDLADALIWDMLPWPQIPSYLKCCHSTQGIFKGHFVVCLQWRVKLSSCFWVNKMLHRLYDESMQLNKLLQWEESQEFPAGYRENAREDKSQSRELQGERTAQWGGPQVM